MAELGGAKRVASIMVEMGANTKPFEQGAKKVKGDMLDLKQSAKDAGGQLLGFSSMAGLATAAFVGLGAAVISSVKAAAEAQRVDAQLAAVLKSTAGAAGLTQSALDDLAVSLMQQSTFSDEAIKGSEALLLTFTQIGKDVFPQAQQAILDLATAMGGDLQGATIQVGKALNDPITGLTALRRVGVSFTDDQMKLIKALVESGQTLKAQQLIVAELNKEFGGSAAAAVDTYSGKMAKLGNNVDQLQELFGGFLLGPLSDATTMLTAEAQMVSGLGDAFSAAAQEASAFANPADKVANLLTHISEEAAKILKITNGALGLGGNKAEIDSATRSYMGMAEALGATAKATEENNDASRDYADTLKTILDWSSELSSYEQDRADLEAQLWMAQKQGYSEWGSKIKGINADIKDLDKRHHDAMLQWISDAYQAQLATDGLFSDEDMQKVLDYQHAVGLLSDDEYKAALNALAIKNALASIPPNTSYTVTEYLNIVKRELKEAHEILHEAISPRFLWVPGCSACVVMLKGKVIGSIVGDDAKGKPEWFLEIFGHGDSCSNDGSLADLQQAESLARGMIQLYAPEPI